MARAPVQQEYYTFTVRVEHLTDKAMLVVTEAQLQDPNAEPTWLPLSQIEITNIDPKTNYYTIEVPQWLAEKNSME